jgi:transcription antitermination factor NusG
MQNRQMSDPLHQGDTAIIQSGPFEGKEGTIAAIDEDLATVTVDVFARDTPVHVPLADLVALPGPS